MFVYELSRGEILEDTAVMNFADREIVLRLSLDILRESLAPALRVFEGLDDEQDMKIISDEALNQLLESLHENDEFEYSASEAESSDVFSPAASSQQLIIDEDKYIKPLNYLV